MEQLIVGSISGLACFLLGVGLTPYLRGYSTKKGENLATHEDIDKVVDQVKAVTQTTKEIEKKVSEEMWDRQKRWELRRDILFEMARKAGYEIDAISKLFATYMTEKTNEANGRPPRLEKMLEVGAAWNSAAAEFEGMVVLIKASCGTDLMKAVGEFGHFMRALSLEIMNGNPDSFTSKSKEMIDKAQKIADAIRKELEFSIKS